MENKIFESSDCGFEILVLCLHHSQLEKVAGGIKVTVDNGEEHEVDAVMFATGKMLICAMKSITEHKPILFDLLLSVNDAKELKPRHIETSLNSNFFCLLRLNLASLCSFLFTGY